MADRVPQYPMVPNNFNPGLPQHPQMTQQGQHLGLVDPQSAGMANSEQARMWQMQQFLAHQRMQGGGEGMGPVNAQMSQQMMDFMRSNSMVRAQGQQLMGQHQQPMNMGQGQMNPNQQFRDLQGGPQQMHPGFNPNFANAGMSNGQQFPVNLSQASAAIAARNPNFLAQMANQGQMSRQLELIGLAQNQQPQNGPAGVAARLAQHNQQLTQMLQHQTQQAGGGNLPQSQNPMGQSNFFPHPSVTPVPDIRQNGSPQAPSQHPMQMGHPQQEPLQGQPQRPMQRPVLNQNLTAEQAIRALMSNRETLRQDINVMTNELQRIRHSVVPKTSDVMAQCNKLEQQIQEKNGKLNQLMKIIQEFDPQKFKMQQQARVASSAGVPNPGMNGGPGPGPNGSSSPMPGQRAGPPMPTQTPVNWPGQQNMVQPSISNQQVPQGSASVQQQLPPRFTEQQMNPSQMGQSGMPQQPNPMTQRSMSAQGHMGQAQQAVNPAMMNGAHQAAMAKPDTQPLNAQALAQFLQTVPQEVRAFVQKPVEPLEAPKFRETYTNFRSRKGLNLDERLLKMNDRSVDLHALHAEVNKEGGFGNVNQKDLWAVIGGRMGFVQLPATGREPAKSGPGVAQHLAHVYALYLKDFDDLYTQTILKARVAQVKDKMPLFNRPGQPPLGAPGMTPNPGLEQAAPAGQNRLMPPQLVQWARFSAAQLRERNIPEPVIQMVEQYRPTLVQQAHQQEQFRAALRQNQAANTMPPNMQQRIPSTGPGQLPNQGQNFAPGSNMFDPSRQVPAQAQPHMGGPTQPDMMNGGLPHANAAGVNGAPPPISAVSRATGPAAVARRPTQEQLQRSIKRIEDIKRSHAAAGAQNPIEIQLSDEQKQEYRAVFDKLCRICEALEPSLPVFDAIWPQEDTVNRILTVIHMKELQRMHFSSSQPKYILSLDKLRQMAFFVHSGSERFHQFVNAVSRSEGMSQVPRGQQPGPAVSAASPPPPISKTPVPPGPAAARPQPPPQGSPARRKPAPSAPTTSTAPTPPALTPGASAAAPITITNSPLLGKSSPKPKATPKPKAAAPAKRKASIKGGEAPPLPEVKRKREDTGLPEPESNAPSPPKKAKTEWEEQPSQETTKRQEAAENIETDEDALAFFNQIQDLIEKQIGSNGALPSECSETLDGIIKGYSGDSIGPDLSGSSGIAGALDPSSLLVSSPDLAQRTSVDNFDAFFDFSSFSALDEEVSVSKAPTPDLVASSSAKPSPESGTDEPGGQGVGASMTTPKIAEATVDDLSYLNGPLRLGIFGEVDGGESLFYSSENWKWEGVMPSSEPAWAISDS
ncbi:hypothetical protein OE88DRAFT_1736329 [Heliocybe sulcata]|uniref:ARID domain-containing protein n=1 Tax=Heliocybe sulcata TaxID=5364 RepID=A0A5C3MYU7_9AGAM|nr:hypothetical protein OE88DRAFT_1736329 [Heliocybe sulcata]